MMRSMRSRRAATLVLTAAIAVVAFSLGRWTRPAEVAAAAEPAPAPVEAPRKVLTKHVEEAFDNQTVYVSGQAFIRCKFHACTLVFRESTYHLEQCAFD